jgi:hypothetical protein
MAARLYTLVPRYWLLSQVYQGLLIFQMDWWIGRVSGVVVIHTFTTFSIPVTHVDHYEVMAILPHGRSGHDFQGLV